MSFLINHLKLNSILRIGGINLRSLQRSSSNLSNDYDRDPQPLFTDTEIQNLLQSITQLNVNKIFRKTTVPDNSNEYKFMTTEELEAEFKTTIERARHHLKMPPVVKVKPDVQKILSKDSALTGFSDTKYVITDITYGLRQSERKVLVRQTDGTLEYAPQDLTKRMNQLYFPLKGRKIQTPRMFEAEYLERCLNEHNYEFILDRLLIQFEPYEQKFHDISSQVYQHINETKEFDLLRSTRHFGPMAFFLAWHRNIDDLLYDMIKRDFLKNGVELIALLFKINNINVDYSETLTKIQNIEADKPEPALEEVRKSIASKSDDIHEEIKTAIGKTSDDFKIDEICLNFIEQYIRENAVKKVQLELAIQTLKEINLEKKQLYEGLTKAHGIQ